MNSYLFRMQRRIDGGEWKTVKTFPILKEEEEIKNQHYFSFRPSELNNIQDSFWSGTKLEYFNIRTYYKRYWKCDGVSYKIKKYNPLIEIRIVYEEYEITLQELLEMPATQALKYIEQNF